MPPFAALALVAAVGLAGSPAGVHAARPIELVYESGIFEGTCTLVHAAPQDGDTMLYFVTSARLFETAQGAPLPPARAVRVTGSTAWSASATRTARRSSHSCRTRIRCSRGICRA